MHALLLAFFGCFELCLSFEANNLAPLVFHVGATPFCNVLSLLFCAVWASEVDPEVQLAAVDALAKLGMSKNPGGSDATQCIQRFMQRYWVADTCRGNS